MARYFVLFRGLTDDTLLEIGPLNPCIFMLLTTDAVKSPRRLEADATVRPLPGRPCSGRFPDPSKPAAASSRRTGLLC